MLASLRFSGSLRPMILSLACFCAVQSVYADGVRIGVAEIQETSILSARDGVSRILQSALYGSIAEQPAGAFTLTRQEPKTLAISHEADVLCADGGALTTQDLVFSIARCLKVRGQEAQLARLGDTDLSNDEAAGIVLRGDEAVLDSVPSCPLMRAWAMSTFGERGGHVDTSVGCGTFKVESFTPGRKVTLVSKGGPQGMVDTLTLQRMNNDDESPRLSLLRRADIDIFLDPTEEEQLSITEDPTLMTVQCDGFAVATRRVLHVHCGPQFFASLLRWEYGNLHEQN